MAMPPSQSIRSESEMVPELRPVMPVDLFRAVMKGDREVLTRRLGLQAVEQTETRVTIDDSHSAPEEINTDKKTVQSELQCATRIGDTILHLLIIEGHNELALMVFKRDMSLLKARNNMSETPLYCAAKVGNEKVIENLIQSDRLIVKDALQEGNKNGDTALHIAARHGHKDIGRMLMNLDQEAAYKVNDKMESPLYMAIIERYSQVVQTMLEVDPSLACTPFSDGMFPIHHSARMGNQYLVKEFFETYPNDVELRDSLGRNLFHIAAEENNLIVFSCVFEDASFREKIERMITTTNYEGDTPFHIAARKGHREIMRAIWEYYQDADTVTNKKGWTPFEVSTFQVVETIENIYDDDISKYVKTEGNKFTRRWFEDVMVPLLDSEDRWERTQVVGLGSVLITTVTFAAAFTIPGGYNEDHGTPILGRKYMFRAFILANTLAFIQGSISLFSLLMTAINDDYNSAIPLATISFLLALSSMIVSFGLGLYVTLTPVCHPIAVLILVISLFFGSPPGGHSIAFIQTTLIRRSNRRAMNYQGYVSFVVSFLIIFFLAFL
ncbi:protein ACCELERATED CELL DEATH 6-like isoform X2 [Carex rostrata]